MNRKFEDNLLRLAFEEISPEEAAELEREARQDPDALLALTQYRSLRAGLKDLAEIPAEQLSKERLRDAILARGLEHKKAPQRGIGWAWMPLTAAALAVVFMNFRPHAPVDPRVMASRTPNLFQIPRIDVPITTVNHDAALATLTVPKQNFAMNEPSHGRLLTAGISRHQTRHSIHRQMDAQVLEPEDGGAFPDIDMSPEPAAATKDTLAASSASQPMNAPMASTPPPAIVLIDGEKDGTTGASKATEVDSGRNVVVGG
jgi:hypothetical protein